MLEEISSRSTRVERVFLVLFAGLFGWALYQRFGVREVDSDTTRFVVLTGALVLMSASALFRRRSIRYGLAGLSALALLVFFVAR